MHEAVSPGRKEGLKERDRERGGVENAVAAADDSGGGCSGDETEEKCNSRLEEVEKETTRNEEGEVGSRKSLTG